MFSIFTTTYSINVFMYSVIFFCKSPKIWNIILQVLNSCGIAWGEGCYQFINLCRYTIYFPAINLKVSIKFFFSLCSSTKWWMAKFLSKILCFFFFYLISVYLEFSFQSLYILRVNLREAPPKKKTCKFGHRPKGGHR